MGKQPSSRDGEDLLGKMLRFGLGFELGFIIHDAAGLVLFPLYIAATLMTMDRRGPKLSFFDY